MLRIFVPKGLFVRGMLTWGDGKGKEEKGSNTLLATSIYYANVNLQYPYALWKGGDMTQIKVRNESWVCRAFRPDSSCRCAICRPREQASQRLIHLFSSIFFPPDSGIHVSNRGRTRRGSMAQGQVYARECYQFKGGESA